MRFKTLIALFFISIHFSLSVAQAQGVGRNNFSLGYGLGTWGGSVIIIGELEPNYVLPASGPFYLKYGRSVSDIIELGVNICFAEYNMGYSYYDPFPTNYYSKTDLYSTFSILVRMNVNLPASNGFEPYIGIGLGYRYGKMTYETGKGYLNSYTIIDSPMGMEATIGTRIYFINNFGMYIEFGAAKSLLQVGVTYKF